ncbi:hypothetical protein B296_00004143 [Ensete ventricosum]|uniref:Uncharacterized protein n=1 Tax=Ensete ventricosum TaxID=4639 RepID=A0A427AHB5_ENSVE|nr:hypothetical protein B296_00004143 [Ensete ventricosum]
MKSQGCVPSSTSPLVLVSSNALEVSSAPVFDSEASAPPCTSTAIATRSVPTAPASGLVDTLESFASRFADDKNSSGDSVDASCVTSPFTSSSRLEPFSYNGHRHHPLLRFFLAVPQETAPLSLCSAAASCGEAQACTVFPSQAEDLHHLGGAGYPPLRPQILVPRPGVGPRRNAGVPHPRGRLRGAAGQLVAHHPVQPEPAEPRRAAAQFGHGSFRLRRPDVGRGALQGQPRRRERGHGGWPPPHVVVGCCGQVIPCTASL